MKGGEGGIAFGDPLSGGPANNECPFASLTPIFISSRFCEQARTASGNKNARYRGTFIDLRRGRDSNPRYKFKLVQRFSKPALSATQAPLRISSPGIAKAGKNKS